jgi:hypothetical protein
MLKRDSESKIEKKSGRKRNLRDEAPQFQRQTGRKFLIFASQTLYYILGYWSKKKTWACVSPL